MELNDWESDEDSQPEKKPKHGADYSPQLSVQYDRGDYIPGLFPFWVNWLYIPDICHYVRQWCIFFKSLYFFAKRTRNVGLFWPLLGPIWSICCKFTHFWWFSLTDLRSVVVYRNWQISGMSRYHSQRSNDLPSIFCGNIDWTYFVIQLVTSNLAVGGTALAWRRARTSQARNRRSAKKIVRRIVEMLLWFHKILLNLLFCIGNLCSLLESDSWF